jgi:ribose transport system permease protein
MAAPEDRSERIAQFLQRWRPSRLLDLLRAARIVDNAVPLVLLLVVVTGLTSSVDGFFSVANIVVTLRQVGEVGFVAIGMAIVVIVGGIDLSVGGIYALCDFAALFLVQYLQWPVGAAVPVVLLVGAALGTINGILIGYLRLRAFLTTLISVIIFRALYDSLSAAYGGAITTATVDSDAWNFLAYGEIAGLGFPVWVCLAFAVAAHIILTRLRPGLHIMAIGGSRRAAHNAGVPVARTVMICYTASGTLTAISAVFFAARLGDVGWDVGQGLEVRVLTGIIAGGIRLGGGSGSVMRALLGLLIVMLLVNGLTSMSLTAGIVSMTLAVTLIVASVFEGVLASSRQGAGTSPPRPEYLKLPSPPVVSSAASLSWELNDRLKEAELLALGQVEGPNEIAFDHAGDAYVGSRHGDVQKLSAPNFAEPSLVAHIGSSIAGLAFGQKGELFVSAGEMGLYRLTTDGTAERMMDRSKRRLLTLGAGARQLFGDGLDVAADGRVYFCENGSFGDFFKAAANGRLLCFDPVSNTSRVMLSGLPYPSGVIVERDGRSILFSTALDCAVKRFWIQGPKKGGVEDVLTNLPAHPGHITAASDGAYWMGLIGGRAPVVDLAWRMPNFRKRLAIELPQDEWPFPQFNAGGVVKFDRAGKIVDVLWDPDGAKFSMITSVREHRGFLYLGGAANNRIGRLKLPTDSCNPLHTQMTWQWDGRK